MDQINALAENWAEIGQQLIPQLPPLEPSLLQSSRAALHYRRRSIPTSLMVDTAIKSQLRGPRDSVSFMAIRKYIALNYRASVLNVNARLRLVKRCILNALEKGKLVRTRGNGVSGSFRLPKQRTLKTSMKKVAKKKPTKGKVNAIRKQMRKQLKKMSTPTAGADGPVDDNVQLVKTTPRLRTSKNSKDRRGSDKAEDSSR